MKFLAAGCSIAHGQGNVVEHYNKENTLESYPNLIADRLGLECNNIAFPGYSNEMIFNSAVQELAQNSYSHCLISWTGNSRDGWENEHEIYTFNLNYARYENKSKPFDDIFYELVKGIDFVSNVEYKLEELKRMYPVIENKIVSQDSDNRLKNYQFCIREICRAQGVHLVEVDAIKNNLDSRLYLLNPKLFFNPKGSKCHPPKTSYRFWAEDIYNKFYAD